MRALALLLALASTGCVPALTAIGAFADGLQGRQPAPVPETHYQPLQMTPLRTSLHCSSNRIGDFVYTDCD